MAKTKRSAETLSRIIDSIERIREELLILQKSLEELEAGATIRRFSGKHSARYRPNP